MLRLTDFVYHYLKGQDCQPWKKKKAARAAGFAAALEELAGLHRLIVSQCFAIMTARMGWQKKAAIKRE
eukprot:1437559-Amphidinium_carterae.1